LTHTFAHLHFLLGFFFFLVGSVVLGRGADKKVWYKVLHENGVEDAWIPLGGKLLSGRVSALVDPQGLLHVFARGRDSAIWEKRQVSRNIQKKYIKYMHLSLSFQNLA
jgi:hypothetical protein